VFHTLSVFSLLLVILNFALNAPDKKITIIFCYLTLADFQLSIKYDRQTTPTDKIKEAHRRVMVANHPDAGGSHYLASKINEAKDMMIGKTKGGGSAF